MVIIFLVVLATLTHAYNSDDTWDNSAEDIFPSSSWGTFDDVNFVSSVPPEDFLGEGDFIVMLNSSYYRKEA
jgi:hypothetical protein